MRQSRIWLILIIVGPGALESQVQQFADNAASRGLNLKKDLVDQLTGAVQAVELDGAEGGETVEGSLLAVQIRDAASMQATLAKIAEFGFMKFSEREFQGHVLYEIEFAGPPGDDGTDSSIKSGIAVAEGHLLFATDVRLLHRVLCAGSAGCRDPGRMRGLPANRPPVSIADVVHRLQPSGCTDEIFVRSV